MNGVDRYIRGIVSHAHPESLGIDLRVLHQGREIPVQKWLDRFPLTINSSTLARKVDRAMLPFSLRWSRSKVIHHPLGMLPSNWASGSASKIVTLHGAARSSDSAWLSKQERNSGELLKRRLQEASHKLSRVVTVSQWSKGELVNTFNLRPEQIEVIPSGVDANKFRPLDNEVETTARLKATFGIQRPYLLHVGPCETRKNVLRLVQAFGDLKQRIHLPHKLVLVGASGPLSPTVQSEIARLELADEIIFPGRVSDEALVRLYNCASVFLFPSLYEGLGLPVLEAMACGTPVVTSNCTALPETSGGAAALVDDPTSIENLSAVIQQVLEDDAYREALRRKGFARAKDFTWEAFSTAHLKLYRQVAEER